jgi:hypothetical protein
MFNDLNNNAHLNHLRAEHRRLHKGVLDLKRTFNAWVDSGAQQPVADILAELSSLHDELMEHFTEEEQGGCLEEAVSRCPRLADTALRIEAEHEDILDRLRHLVVRLEAQPLTLPEVKAIEGYFLELCQEIQRHEAAETQVMTAAFGESA